ncbi:MAG: ABC transporter [Ignavibacteria bacterium CG22_combo_CG10-13_8_21_14_all_37_15]|nr:ABC transporter ATP-binding protein [Ignavibacteria bacterium]PIP77915.1 MAG: ABC transporter [Ignavibacteria bacterium CG22_combo_CG10-13_8_21_14_all_37_15]
MTNLKSLKKYFVRYKRKIFWGMLFILISNGFSTYVPILIKDAINDLQKTVSQQALINYGLLIAGTSLIAGVFRFLIRQTIIVVSREIEFDLRQDFWAHIQRLPLRYFQNNSTGNIMAHATNDINAVRMFIGPAVMYTIDTGIRFLIVFWIMLSIDISVTLYSLLPLPFLSFMIYFIGKKIHVRFTAIQEKFSELTTKAQENYSGIRVIKSYVREENEIDEFANLSKDYLHRNMKLVKIQALFQPILFLLTGISVIIVIWVGGSEVINNELKLGDITALIIYLGLLIWPIIAFGWVINIIQQAEASMKRLNKILAEPFEVEETEETDFSIKGLHGKILLKNVSFRYKEHLPEVLKNINLEIPVGTTLAIMGLTGAGKTTLINLLPRLYDITGGEIFIDDIPINKIPLATLRRHIGFVQQETFLFSDSIANNLCYGLREGNYEKMMEASRIAQFDKDVKDFPNGYETIIGERGITLSGGQKQRATIARSLVIDPKILILDDSFSAVDTHTEEEILKDLKIFMKERTSVIISHRISTVKDADKIVVLDKGTIAEEGTHDELLALNKLYADIYYKQLLEKEIEEFN